MFVYDFLLLQNQTITSSRSHRRRSMKRVVIKISENSKGGIPVLKSFFNKVAGLRPATLLKKRLQSTLSKKSLQYMCFFCEFSKIVKRTFFTENLRATASEKEKNSFGKCLIHVTKQASTVLLFCIIYTSCKILLSVYYRFSNCQKELLRKYFTIWNQSPRINATLNLSSSHSSKVVKEREVYEKKRMLLSFKKVSVGLSYLVLNSLNVKVAII